MTAFIVQVSLGDTPTGTLEYRTIFVVGMSLFVFTLVLNTAAHFLRRRLAKEGHGERGTETGHPTSGGRRNGRPARTPVGSAWNARSGPPACSPCSCRFC
jgi:hypothetical protein